MTLSTPLSDPPPSSELPLLCTPSMTSRGLPVGVLGSSSNRVGSVKFETGITVLGRVPIASSGATSAPGLLPLLLLYCDRTVGSPEFADVLRPSLSVNRAGAESAAPPLLSRSEPLLVGDLDPCASSGLVVVNGGNGRESAFGGSQF